MAESQSNISQNPKVAYLGINMDSVTRQVKPGQLSYALNAVIENFDGQSLVYQNEQANTLCTNFPSGYRIIGSRNIIEDGMIVLWLANPTTGASEIGVVKDCTYSTHIDPICLNLDVNHPILKSVIKRTNCTLEVYWTDGKNPRRFTNLLKKPFKQEEGCPPVVTDEVDCNQLLVQPNFSIPDVRLTGVDIDGSQKAGTVQFAVQYSNVLGEGYTSYFSVTNPLPLFDINKITQDFNYEVGKSVTVEISRLDTSGYYDYFNLAVIKTINDIPSAELVGTYQITGDTKTISYTGQSKEQIRLTPEDIFEKFPIYDVAQDVTVAQDIIIWDQLTTQERISYQKIANQITLQWQTWKLNDDKPYGNELVATYLRGFMRDEVYPLEFVPLLDNGHQADGFHIPGRAPTASDLVLVANNDVIDGNLDKCHPTSQPLPRWEVYNTGCLEGFEPDYLEYIEGETQTTRALPEAAPPPLPPPTNTEPNDPDCYVGPYQYGCMAYWESTETYPCNPEVWGPLSNQPIRHHKFPDSLITHIHDNTGSIFPIGIKINIAQIYDLIQASDLTPEQKARVVGFKIVRGNRANNKSIIAKGLIHNVGKYEKEEQTYFFPNYPYNDLREDRFLGSVQTEDDDDDEESKRLNAFATDDSKKRFTFHSPDTHFYQPFLGNILKLETAEFGKSRSHFQEVKKHSRYKFLSTGAYATAFAVGIGAGIASAELGTTIKAFDGTAAFTAFKVLLDIIERVMPRKNFAYQYNSVGEYTDFKPIQNTGNKQRFLEIASYLVPGMTGAGDIHRINNYQRESSVYLRTNKTLPFPSSIPGVPTDMSRWVLSENDCVNEVKLHDISSYYASIKRRFINQYGQIYSYETIDTGYQFFFDDIPAIYASPYRSVFGGDTFINRFAYKSKLPLFIDNRVNFPDEADIEYDKVGNVAYPLYWFSTEASNDTTNVPAIGFIISPLAALLITVAKPLFGIKVNNFDCDDSNSKFFYQSGKIYLFVYGIPYFYCESGVNTDLRQAYNDKEGDFYPHVGEDIPDEWLQEVNVPIAQDNSYWYNRTYSKQNKENFFSHLADDFTQEECLETLPFRAIFSERQDDLVNYRRNNWLIYRPSAKYDFPQTYGKLTSLEGIENRQVLARFENKSQLYNALLTAPTSAADVFLGQSMFSQNVPPLDFAETEIGYTGSQHKFFLKTEYGHVSADAKRGQVFLFNGAKATELTMEGVNKFFVEYLDFEIKKSFPDVNIDNHFNGVGLHGVYDTKYDRFILTKLDYVPIVQGITEKDGKFFFEGEEISLTDTEYFCSNSFTISYSFKLQAWVSMHTYLPNFYIGDTNFFYSGINGEISSMWRHNTEMTRYNNFYGQIHPYIIEYPFAYESNDELLQNVRDYTKVIRYTDWQSYVETDDVWFNKVILWNGQQSSGVLIPVAKPKNNLAAQRGYPVYNTDSKEILFTKRDNFYQINTFWSLTKNSQLPIWKKSCESLSIFKELDQSNADYGKRSYKKAPLRAKDLKIRLINDDKDDVKLVSQFLLAPTMKSYV